MQNLYPDLALGNSLCTKTVTYHRPQVRTREKGSFHSGISLQKGASAVYHGFSRFKPKSETTLFFPAFPCP